jgi:hypothetical protein
MVCGATFFGGAGNGFDPFRIIGLHSLAEDTDQGRSYRAISNSISPVNE